MRIKTKSIYDPAEDGDGFRVLVTRLWPRGIKKELADLWVKDLGPSTELLRAYKDGKIGWGEFKKRYLDEYGKEDKKRLLDEVREALRQSKKRNLTLMCTCREPDHCHRRILEEKLGG